MVSRARSGRWAARLSLAAALAGTAASGCRTDTRDIERWATTVNGPRKLEAVILHQKYGIDLRVEAALALVKMKPRAGKRVGIEHLVETLSQLSPGERSKLLDRIVPVIEAELLKPPPAPVAGQPFDDPSAPYKDAAYALLTQKDGTLLVDDAAKAKLRAALAHWAAAAFAERLEDTGQMFGMEQLLRLLGAQGVRGLTVGRVPEGKRADRIADLVADLGDDATRLDASQRLVVIAKDIDSEAWMTRKSPELKQRNEASGFKDVKPEQFKAQLDEWQEQELIRVFSSMKRVGGAPAVDYLLGYAAGKGAEKRRAAALAAVEGRLDKKNPQHLATVLAIASAADTPDPVRDQALRRVGEMPRELVAPKLYELFNSEKWKVRWVAGELVLRMGDASHLKEFFEKIGSIGDMAMAEALGYGQQIASLKPGKDGKPVVELVDAQAASGPVPARLSALGYYYHVGTVADLGKVTPYQSDGTRTPKCREGAPDCDWTCFVMAGNTKEAKLIGTVGEFVTHCVKPAMEKREAPKK